MLNCWLMARGIVPANSAGTVSASQRTQERTPVKNSLDSLSAGRKTELFGWLTEEGRFAPDIGRLLEVLCEKLTALGVPIARATTHVRTLHPEFRGATRIWRRGESIEIRTTRHGIEFTSDYQNSPIQYINETGQWLDTILSETTDRHFPILATLRAQGITHYVMAPLIFSNRIVNAMSWATDAPGGFTEADVELFRDFVTAFVPVLEAMAVRRIYGELLATYVGRDPSARIMAGAVQRGDVRHLKAAMLLADLRKLGPLPFVNSAKKSSFGRPKSRNVDHSSSISACNRDACANRARRNARAFSSIRSSLDLSPLAGFGVEPFMARVIRRRHRIGRGELRASASLILRTNLGVSRKLAICDLGRIVVRRRCNQLITAGLLPGSDSSTITAMANRESHRIGDSPAGTPSGRAAITP